MLDRERKVGLFFLGRISVQSSSESGRDRVQSQFEVRKRFSAPGLKGDGVVTYDPSTREYLVGEITSDYRYEPGLIPLYPNIRDVVWNSRVSRDALESDTRNSLGSTLTLFAVSPEAWEDIQFAAKGKKHLSAS